MDNKIWAKTVDKIKLRAKTFTEKLKPVVQSKKMETVERKVLNAEPTTEPGFIVPQQKVVSNETKSYKFIDL